ncbi:MAG: cell surface protein SprA [Sphingobacteriales bacterium]
MTVKTKFSVFKYSIPLLLCGWVVVSVFAENGTIKNINLVDYHFLEPDSNGKDTLKYPLKPKEYSGTSTTGGLDLKDPEGVEKDVEYDSKTNQYIISERLGRTNYRQPTYMSFEQYADYEAEQAKRDYWKERSNADRLLSGGSGPQLPIKSDAFDRIFGGSSVNIRPQGFAELTFGVQTRVNNNPALNERSRKITNFDFDQSIQMNVVGNIGDKLKLITNYNTEASFDFENQVKIEYTGYEDEIIKKIEAGNVSLPLSGTLIQGSQSLFGVKTELQFGKLRVTAVATQEKSDRKEITIKGGAQTQDFEIAGDQYDVNRHYFLSHYFRDNYEQSLQNLPVIQSNVQISQVEVWVTNDRNATENVRDILAFIDLGEPSNIFNPAKASPKSGRPFPDNNANALIDGLPTGARNTNSTDIVSYFNDGDNYSKLVNARKLNDSEFDFHPQLGYLSLNRALNSDEVLAVSYRYSINGEQFTVGELSSDIQKTEPPTFLYTKLLKNTNVKTNLPTWDLMMKNIYSFNGFRISPEDFRLDILYLDNQTSNYINYLPEGDIKLQPLIQVLNVDNVNTSGASQPDGYYDFLEGITINSNKGTIIFPLLEPFGASLAAKINNTQLEEKYVYQELYDLTKFRAQEFTDKNRFRLEGTYKSSVSSEFSLSALNIPKGAVKVTAGSQELTEGLDYTVDYTLGRVKITNEGVLRSGKDISIKVESSALFGIVQKSLIGTRFDYAATDKLSLGGTALRLSERPFTNKVNLGEEPISNSIYGLDANYSTDSRFLTALVDKLPFIETKAPSSITASAEYAYLRPGHSKAIDIGDDKGGVSYVDDFEGAQSVIDLRNPFAWNISSTPKLFPESGVINSLEVGKNRSLLSFYRIDQLFYENNSATPSHIRSDENTISDVLVAQYLEQDLFPSKSQNPLGPQFLQTFDLTYYPQERGPYNYNVDRIQADGTLSNPSQSWAGITRKLESSDFESLNIEFIEFWVMDPFHNNQNSQGGKLYFNLGDVSEDVLRDSRQSFENGLPPDSDPTLVDSTKYGIVPKFSAIVNTFDLNPNSRDVQDVGLDGLDDQSEKQFFKTDFLNQLKAKHPANSAAVINAEKDPSADNYFHFLSGDQDSKQASIIERYKSRNQLENNSPTSDQALAITGFETGFYNAIPSTEDINGDNNLNENEAYYQYEVDISPQSFRTGNRYVTDSVVVEKTLPNNKVENVTWYQFKVPISQPDEVINDVQGFNSIRFIRMFMTGFNEQTTMRFGRLQLVRGDWRRFTNLPTPTSAVRTDDDDQTTFDVTTINIEDNGRRTPIPYVLPPGLQRERDITNPRATNNLQNEQSLVLRVGNLQDGDARAAFKNIGFDFRSYKNIEMFIHAEGPQLNDGDLTAFIRIGTDVTNNYYEYEIPLVVTQDGQAAPELVWPDANKFEIPLDVLQTGKQRRNISGKSFSDPFTFADGNNKVTILGAPDLSKVKTIMLGVRNPRKGNNQDDDGLAKSGQVWFNELRLNGFEESGGWAATGRVNTKMADFANITLSGRRETIGFGALEDKVNDRNRDDKKRYDASGNFELGKFFPEEAGVKVPMYVAISKDISTPQYSPASPDIDLRKVIDELPPDDADSILRISRDITTLKSINFTNVRKERNAKKAKKAPMPYDIENFNASISYSEAVRTNFQIEYDTNRLYNANLGYTYSPKIKPIRPFSGVRNKNLRIVKDLSIEYLPNNFKYGVNIDRKYQTVKRRNINNVLGAPEQINYNKAFNMNRNWGLNWNFTQNLKFDMNANYRSLIKEEPDKVVGRIDNAEEHAYINRQLLAFGTNQQYNHTSNLNYNVPLNKIPFFNWTSVNASYGSGYTWTAPPLATPSLNNTISNNQTFQLNTNLTLTSLYNKVKFFKDIDKNAEKRKQSNTAAKNAPSARERFQTGIKNVPDSSAKDTVKEKKEGIPEIVRILVKGVLSVKSIGGVYSVTNGTTIPSYTNDVGIFGLDNNTFSPGIPFVFGNQNDIRQGLADDRWLETDTLFNYNYLRGNRKDLNLRSSIEPFKGFRIDLNATRSLGFNYTELFFVDPLDFSVDSLTSTTTGSFSMSYITIGTAFEELNEDSESPVVERLKGNRFTIAERLAIQNPNSIGVDSTGSPTGYRNSSQQVLLYSFLAAYRDIPAGRITLNPFPAVPIPNWRVNYNGLGKIPALKEIFSSVNLTHSYRSVYSIGGFTQTAIYKENGGFPDSIAQSGNFIPKYQANAATISEQFAPLIGVSITTRSNVTLTFDYKKSRNLNLGFSSSQVTEQRSNEFSFSAGYRTSNINLPINFGNGAVNLKNDINFRLRFSIQQNQGIVHIIDENRSLPNTGSTITSIKPEIDYVVNERLNINIFYDRRVTDPFTSQTFKTSFSTFGVKVRFTLSN